MTPSRGFPIAPLLLAAAVAAAWVWGTSARRADPESGSSQPVLDEPGEPGEPAAVRYWFGSTGGTRDPVPARAKRPRAAPKCHSVEGRVLAPDGEPLRGVEVSLTSFGSTDYVWSLCVGPDGDETCVRDVEEVPPIFLSASTDDDGRFLVEDIPADACEFWVSVMETGSYAATPVDVKLSGPGKRAHVTIQTWSVGILEIDVLGPDGSTVEVADVRLAGEAPAARSCRRDLGTAYQARVRVGRHTASVTSPAGTAPPLDVDVPAGGTVRHTVRLAEGTSLAGTIVDAAGKPVWGVLVSAFRADDPADPGRAAVSRSDGTFRVTGLRPGAHRVVLAGNGFEPTSAGTFDAPANGLRVPVPAGARRR